MELPKSTATGIVGAYGGLVYLSLAGVGVGLVLVALGSGALKASASSLLGTLYDKATRGVMVASPCSIWVSTSAPSSAR